MPTANRRQFIPGAIARFLAQDYENAELVILDDGEVAVADLVPAHEKIRYVRTGKHRTLGDKRNRAAAAARGEILLHWDDDDWYAPERIRLQVDALVQSGADVCGAGRVFFIDPRRCAAWEYIYPHGRNTAPWVYGATLCYRRSYWQAHPFAALQVGEDTQFAATVPAERLHVMARSDFYVALIHAGNTSPKQVHGQRWQQADFSAVTARTGAFWNEAPHPAPRGPVLVAAASGLGDILRTTPLIRALHMLGHEVDVLLAPDNAQTADLLRGAPEIAALHVVPDSTQGHATRPPEEIAGRHYELSVFTRWAAPLAPYIRAGRSLHFNPAQWLEQGDSACVAALAHTAGWHGKMPPPFARHSGRGFALPPGSIGLHPGCKPDWPWKRWHGFAELAARLENTVLLGTQADRDGAGSYFAPPAWPAGMRDFTGQLTLADTAALISQCSAVIANDSGLMHLAAVLGVPTIGIFGITSPAREAMDLPAMHVLTKGLACEPDCRRAAWGRRDCAQHLACLRTLTADEVLARLHTVLAPPRPAPVPPRSAPVPAARLSLAVHMEGGIGDVILAARLVEAAWHALDQCDIDIYYQAPEVARFVFHGTPFIRHILAAAPPRAAGYDLSVSTLHYAGITVHNEARVRQLCPETADRLAQAGKNFAPLRGLADKRPHLDGLWGRIAAAAGRNALDNLGYCSGLALSRQTELTLTPEIDAMASLPALLGAAGCYITVHDGFDNSMKMPPGGATKCWPLAHWEAFVSSFKATHPDCKVVQLGNAKSRAIAGVDVNLLGRTSLHQTSWLIKTAALHVDTDSGLVHLARAVHTRAVVLFGPTDARLYGHDAHIVVNAGNCAPCWWSTPDWLAHCPRGLKQPVCMSGIMPEQVLAAVASALAVVPASGAERLRAALYDGALLTEKSAWLQDIFENAGLAPVPITAHARNKETGVYLHASKQWEYLFALGAVPAAPQRILDAGGGRGALAWHLAACGHEVEVIDNDFGTDHDGEPEIGRRYLRSSAARLRLRHGGLHNLPAADASFDMVLCISVVEHLCEKATVLRELMRVLRPGGILVLTFDLACEPEQFQDQWRIEVFSPACLADFLAPLCGHEAIFTPPEVAEAAARVQADGVAGVPEGMTVGGIVFKKFA